MIDKEKVITGLETCTLIGPWETKCKSCPYHEDNRCSFNLMRDALHLILGEPHKVLSLEEIVNEHGSLITEFRYGIEPQYFSLGDRCSWLGEGKKYGVTWRCWDSMPSEEERKKTEWTIM